MKDATEILGDGQHDDLKALLRDGAEVFHNHEGKMFERYEGADALAERLDIDEGRTMRLIANLVGDVVDPVVQVVDGSDKYVGIIDYDKGDGYYRYTDYDDIDGTFERVVCAKCVKEAEVDTDVQFAAQGLGSFADDAPVSELIDAILDHYEDDHDVSPDGVSVETGATLASGTTVSGNVIYTSANDGSGSGIDADKVDGKHKSDL